MAALIRTICLIGLILPGVVLADEERKALVTSIAKRHAVESETSGQTLEMRPEPILVWSNPIRGDTTGGVFLWRDGERPLAYGGVYIWKDNGQTLLSREFHSLTNEKLSATFDGQSVWTPSGSNLQFKPLKKGNVPAASPLQRLRQIKRIAAAFEIEISQHQRTTDKLRALPTPIYRYRDEKSGIVDGVIIAFCQGNDPEALLVVEAIKSDAVKMKWRYALARSTAWAIKATMDNEVVFEVDRYQFKQTPPTSSFLILKKQPI